MRISKSRTRGIVVPVVILLVVAGCGTQPTARTPAAGTSSPPSPTATPLLDEPAALEALTAFAKLIEADDLTFHLEETATGAAAAQSVATNMTMDVAGNEFAAVMKVAGKTLQLRMVNGKAWVKVPGKPWARGDANMTTAADVVNPWLYLCWLNDLIYTGHPSARPDAFAFECRREYSYQTLTMRQKGWTATMRTMALVLAADGTPVEMRMEGDGPAGAGSPTSFEATMAFSNVGEKIKIKAPK